MTVVRSAPEAPPAHEPQEDRAATVSHEGPQDAAPRSLRDFEWSGIWPFTLVHLAAFGALWSGVTWQAVVCCAALFAVRMFGVTAGYHRFFSHRSFKTSRLGQLCLAFLAETSAQKGVLWWAAHHRYHHRHSDRESDLHSPRHDGFWYAHLGWLWNRSSDTAFQMVPDLVRYPELVWLNRFHHLPPVLLAVAVGWLFGWPGFFIGFCLSTVILWHTTFFINSLAHVWGRRRYPTEDDSRNSLTLALLTLGEGWHNNHHFFPGSARQGFYWWELDITYYLLKALSWLGLVWDLREPPARVLAAGRGRA